MDTLRLQITGMTCAACSARIEKGLRRMDGVVRADVSMATAQAIVEFDPRIARESDIRLRIERLGYGASAEIRSPHEAHDAEIRALGFKLAVAIVLSLPLFWAMLSHVPALAFLWIPPVFFSPWVQLGLATALQFYVGYPFYLGAFQALKQRSANMDTLVALSTSVAYFYSHGRLFRSSFQIGHDQLYFDTIAMILTVILLGKLLEAKAKGRALKDLNELYGLQIRFVRVNRGQGEDWIPVEELRKGDEVVVHAGEWISADGTIVSGAAEADESLLTGESLPVLKAPGDDAYSGTRCLNGSLRIRAGCDAGHTRLSRMIATVEEAQRLKPSIARKVDRAAAAFVPVMVACAALTFAAWSYGADAGNAIRYGLAVLLIACPCALGLAAPVSILIATSLAARKGILFKHGNAMETLAKTDRVLFDKTGTLTEGKPQLKAIRPDRYPGAYLLKMAAAVERHSVHPLGLALVEAAEKRGIVMPATGQLKEVPGGGMEGVVDGKRVRVGHPEWVLGGAGKRGDASAFGRVEPGETLLCISIDRRLEGTFLLADSLRPDAVAAAGALRRTAGLVMVTGDQPVPAEAIARQAGINDVRAACSPERKAEIVDESRRAGHVVAFVGDGNNDAAALAAADVGIAMSGGAGSAMQTGDIVLTRNRLTAIAEAIEISRLALRNIKQNIGFAIAYNLVAVPLAATGALDPRVACMGMAASSLIVVANALRLRASALARGTNP